MDSNPRSPVSGNTPQRPRGEPASLHEPGATSPERSSFGATLMMALSVSFEELAGEMDRTLEPEEAHIGVW
jgi:hypothetical protein